MGTTKEAFTEMLKKEVQALLPKCEIKETHVTKINDLQLTGLTIIRQGENGDPTYYIDDAYEDFTSGKADIKALAISLVNYHFASSKTMPEIIGSDDEHPDLGFDKVKDCFSLRVVDKTRNREYLKDKPYKDVGCDLALIAVIELDRHMGMFVTITDALADEYGYDMSIIFKAAESNTHATMKFSGSMLFAEEAVDLLSVEADVPIDEGFFVVSNNECFYGAAGLFANGVKKRICDIFGSGYYIIPSSVHEILVLPDYMVREEETLKFLVKKVNDTAVDTCDQLSDNVYHYDEDEGFKIVA